MTRTGRVARLGRGVPWIIGLAMGLLALRVALLEPGFSSIAVSPLSVVVGLAAGWSLVAVGLTIRRREPGNRAGALLVLAGLGWFAVELSNPASGSAVLFTVGLVLGAAVPPLVAHATLAYPSGTLEGRAQRAAIIAAYATGIVWSGVLATLVYDPGAERCAFCPSNLLSLGASGATHDLVTRLGVVMLAVWSPAVVALALRRVALASSIRRMRIGPVVLAGAAFVTLMAVDGVWWLTGGRRADAVTIGLGILQGTSLIAMAGGVAWPWFRARRTRTAVARLVVELGASRDARDVRDLLSRELGDAQVEIAYPLADGRSIGSDGRPVDVGPEPGRAVTPVVRGGDVIAVLRHRGELLDDPTRIDDVVAALRLTLDGDRLRAELQAQLEDLRASRVRLVEAADAERRRLERDLHDGAQQRLVGLAMALAMLDRELERHGMTSSRRLVAEASDEVRAGIAQLRDLAHGIYPAELSGEGLAAALEALQETSAVAIRLGPLPAGRLDPRVESTAYFVVAETLRQTAADNLRVAAERDGDRLVVEIAGATTAPDDLVGLDDRVGALDGTIEVRSTGTSHLIRAEIPCGS